MSDSQGDSDMTEPGVIAVKLGVELVKRVTPKGMAWVTTWIKGKKLLIVGQPRAGKTSLVNYFQFGLFTDPAHKTPRTRDIKKTAAFSVDMGRDKALHLEVRSMIDTVGQALASDHAKNVSKYKPDAIVLVLDLSSNWQGDNEYSAGFYLKEFLLSLSARLNNNKGLRKSIKSIFIVLNKKDLVKPKKIAKWKKFTNKLLQKKLFGVLGVKSDDVSIMACTLIETSDSGKSANNIISKIALSMVKS